MKNKNTVYVNKGDPIIFKSGTKATFIEMSYPGVLVYLKGKKQETLVCGESFKVVKKKNNIINVIYIGDQFYMRSGTMMSSVYLESSWERTDWAFIQEYVKKGKVVNIRSANKTEMKKAKKMLQSLCKKR